MERFDTRPLHGVAVYNPDLLSRQELVTHFVARRPLFERIVADLRREGTQNHRLIIGQRGMGKTTLLRRLRVAVEDDAELHARWIALTFPEEQYNVSRLSDFYLNCIDSLGDALEQAGHAAEASALDEQVAALAGRQEAARSRGALEVLLEMSRKLGRRLLLLVDNVDIILDRLKDERWSIREMLSAEQRLLLVGASATAIESTYRYDEPFYDFFQVEELRGLDLDETREVLVSLARIGGVPAVERLVQDDPARIRTLHVLAGGNPRTLVLLYTVLAQGTEGDVRSDLERLLDLCTPLYKARFEQLATQAQQVVHALALHWDPAGAGELAAELRLETNVVSAQLNRLAQQGVVEKVAFHPSTKIGFQIAERFFNIWYLMRASRRMRRRLIWLVEFLRLLYGAEHLREHAAKQLGRKGGGERDARLRQAEYHLALAQVVDDPPLRYALESSALHELASDRKLRAEIAALVDLEGPDAPLKPLVDQHSQAAELAETIRASVVTMPGWNPDHIAELLSGSWSLGPALKAQMAARCEAWISADIVRLLEEERKAGSRIWGERATSEVRDAIRQGFMVELDDVKGAQAFALRSRQYGALAIALLSNCETSPRSDELLAQAKAAVTRAAEAPLWNAFGNILRIDSRWVDAEAAYRKAIDLDPEDARYWHGLGYVLRKHLSRFDEAEAAYRKAIDLDPEDARYWNSLGYVLGNHQGRFDDAEAAYRKAIDLDAKDAIQWHNLGSVLRDHPRRFDEAEAAYRKAIELDPKDARHWNSLGYVLGNHLGRFDDAEAAYRKAIDLDPKFASPWFGLAGLLGDLGRFDDAEAACRKAIDLDPTDKSAFNRLAWLLYMQGRVGDEAESFARQAVALAPGDRASLHTLATILCARDSWPEAVIQARRFIGNGTVEFWEGNWADIMTFCHEAVRTGHAGDLGALLDELGLAERWRPLREVLKALAAGDPELLLRVAPEVRAPAQQILHELQLESMPAPTGPRGSR